MKKLIILIGIVILSGCSTMKPATSYNNNIHENKTKYVGKVTYVMEKEGYSIINVDSMCTSIYIMGTVKEIQPPYKDAHVYVENTKKGDLYKYNFIYDDKKYLADKDIMKKQ